MSARKTNALLTLTRVAIDVALVACPAVPTGAYQPRSTVSRVVVTARLDESEGDVVATLQNKGTVALEAWRLTIVYSTRASASSSFSTTSDTFAALAAAIRRPGTGPVQLGESRELRLQVPAIRVLKSAAVDGALFGDLSFEGEPAVRDEILRGRDAQGAALTKWIAVLADAGAKAAEAGQVIRRALAAVPGDADDPMRVTVERLLDSPDPAAASRELRPIFERVRELALRHRR